MHVFSILSGRLKDISSQGCMTSDGYIGSGVSVKLVSLLSAKGLQLTVEPVSTVYKLYMHWYKEGKSRLSKEKKVCLC